MEAKSIKGKSPEKIKMALAESMADGFKPTLAIVFISVSQDRKAIYKILDDADIIILACTTQGEFIDEETGQESVAILLPDMNTNHFQVLFAEYPLKNYLEIAGQLAKKAMEKFPHPAFLISASQMVTEGEQLLFGFEDVIGKQLNIFGSMAGDDYQFAEQFVFTNGSEGSSGIVALVLDEDKIKIKGRATCGWEATGTVKDVTKSEGNHVFTVDDVPVLDLTAKYGGLANVSPDNSNLVLEIATKLPLQLQRETGEPFMRPVLKIAWEDHSFYCNGSVPQDAKVRFSLQPDFDVIEKVIKDCEDLKKMKCPKRMR